MAKDFTVTPGSSPGTSVAYWGLEVLSMAKVLGNACVLTKVFTVALRCSLCPNAFATAIRSAPWPRSLS